MLEVQRQALVREAFAGQLSIIQQEVQLMNDNLNALATQSAMLIGLTISFFSADSYNAAEARRLNQHVEAVYYLCAIIAFLLQLFVVSGCTIVSTKGSRMSIAGTDLSASKIAVKRMQADESALIRAMCASLAFQVLSMGILINSWHIGTTDDEDTYRYNIGLTVVYGIIVLVAVTFLVRMNNRYQLSQVGGHAILDGPATKISADEYVRIQRAASAVEQVRLPQALLQRAVPASEATRISADADALAEEFVHNSAAIGEQSIVSNASI